ncbi:hypothetical protein JJB07_06075 [Tumebacillus sp. ITR2]|uniref:Uncharacterized protein n=1 Tax=Tumebacillus amylolyticus TaxID=2801339 RepID=A0ABS1J9A1_9BACL|nr:CLC_0170 family protein [Tumebacillus amylolyticus]MBL0386218.1 hypothetical protein [Tumebacillus amylolyticus]
MTQLSYLNYLVLLFEICGVLTLVIDSKKYNQKQQTKEEKLSRFFGWTNIVLGVAAYVGNWMMQNIM